MKSIYKLLSAGALTIAALGFTSTAEARCSSGEIANFLGNMTGRCDIARQADQVHANMGRPLDHMANQAAGAAANYVVPGSGMYVTQGLEMRDQFNRSQFNQGGFMPAGPVQQQQMQPQIAFGSVCLTQMGRSGFGPLNPVGSQCNVMGPYGPVFGVVIQ